MKKIFLLTVLGLVGCGSMAVKPTSVSNLQQANQVCIEDNPKVTVPAFDEYLKEGFARHQIKTKIYDKGSVPDACELTLHYVAFRSWDMGTYLSVVKLELLDKNDDVVGLVDWRQNDFALNKWRSDKGKVYDLVDQLLNKAPKSQQ